MTRRLPLRVFLNAAFAALLALWLLIDVARVLWEARPRALEEARSATRVTRAYFESLLANLQTSPNPEIALMSLIGGVSYLNPRHVRVGLSSNALAPMTPRPDETPSLAPGWFRALAALPDESTSLPAVIGGRRFGWIVIHSDSSDAIDEVWKRVRAQIGADLALGVVLLLASSVVVTRALRPLNSAGEALARLEAGDFSARAELAGAREFVEIASRINALGAALGDLSASNRELLVRSLDAHEEERKTIANELHDEIGPHLFALRAQVATLRRAFAENREAGRAVEAIGQSVESLQKHNRRILSTLRPAALDDLGLSAALDALAEYWRRAEPNVELTLSAAPGVEALSPRASLTVYRVVQEALTNAYRHSGAAHIDVEVSYDSPRPRARFDDAALAGLRIRVLDDGQGVDARSKAGLGLAGMRDRVAALGGVFVFRASPEAGAAVEAWFGGDAPAR